MTRILYCNTVLEERSGTEVVTLETVLGLRRRGHHLAVLVGSKEASATELSNEGIDVICSPGDVPWTPEIVHSNHLVQSLDAAAAFPDVAQVFMCHDARTWHSAPPPLSIIRRWLAADEACEDRIRLEAGVRVSAVTRLLNAVDLEKFTQRSPLPDRPQRALLLAKNDQHRKQVKQACASSGLSLDMLGRGAGDVVDDLHARLGQYDIVFATARMALEAMAAGCAVVVVDGRGLAGLVTSANVDAWRQQNFGFRLLTNPITTNGILAEIRRYDPSDSHRVSNRIRAVASYDGYLDVLNRTYAEAMAEFRAQPVDPRTTLSELPAGFRRALMTHRLRSGEPRPLDWIIGRLRDAHEASRRPSLGRRARTRLRRTLARIKQRVWPSPN